MSPSRRSRYIALKAELRSLKLGDLTIDAYFSKIESIANILASFGSPISKGDIVNIALDGLPNKYELVSDIIIHQEPFLDLKIVSSILTTVEMQLKSRAQATSIDSSSSSPVVLLANSGNNNTRRSTGASEQMMALIQMQQAMLSQFGYNGTTPASVNQNLRPNANYSTTVGPAQPILGLTSPYGFSQLSYGQL
ncbi:hypothetical protein Tco_0251125 [Tanacetum coccineum]